MRTKIISAFPGTGKSYYHQNHKDTTLDSDSSKFSWVDSKLLNSSNLGIKVSSDLKIRNPNFPQNYIEHIKENIGKYKYIFVSSHKEVRDALCDNCLCYWLVYPTKESKDLYLERYVERGSDQAFIDLVNKNWDLWLDELRDYQEGGVLHFSINENETVMDFIEEMRRENYF